MEQPLADTLYPHLKRGEVILWQGRPTRSFAPGVGAIVPVLFGLGFASIAIFAIIRSAEGGVVFSLAYLFAGIGLSLALHALFRGMLIRRWSHYALTHYRAFVLIDHPFLGADIKSWPITPSTDLRHDTYNPMTITFAYEPRRFFGRRSRVIGFEHIEDGLNVFRVMMDVRDGLH